MDAGDMSDDDHHRKPLMFSDDSDLDALLDAQSSDEDHGEDHVRPPGVERTIDDILLDFDEFGLDDVDSAPSTPHKAVQPGETAEKDQAVEAIEPFVAEKPASDVIAGEGELDSEVDSTGEPIDDSPTVDEVEHDFASVESSASSNDGDALSVPPLPKVDVVYPEPKEIIVGTSRSAPTEEPQIEDSTSARGEDAVDVEVADNLGGGRSEDGEASSETSDDDIEFDAQATWETDESDTAEEESGITSQSLDTTSGAREETRKQGAEDFPCDPGPREKYTALDKAEEFEKKVASSGLDFEEGAAAQPMRLEGIQRGPPAIGILQLDSGGSLSHALGTPAMRRDHGHPQALAVHASYIAVGMSKGAVLVNSSKYAPTRNAENAESKVICTSLS